MRIRRITQPEEHASTDVSDLSPGERMSMMWQLTLQAWMFKEGLTDEPHMRRDIVCVIRGNRWTYGGAACAGSARCTSGDWGPRHLGSPNRKERPARDGRTEGIQCAAF
jgi:hypothetical protein